MARDGNLTGAYTGSVLRVLWSPNGSKDKTADWVEKTVRINRFSSLRLIPTDTRNGRPSASYERHFPIALTSWKLRSTENSDVISTCKGQLSKYVHYRLSLGDICATYHQYRLQGRGNYRRMAVNSSVWGVHVGYFCSCCSDGRRESHSVVYVVFFLGFQD